MTEVSAEIKKAGGKTSAFAALLIGLYVKGYGNF